MKTYFLRTVKDGSKIRLRPIEGQTDQNGQPLNPLINTQGNMAIREEYPIGTAFATRQLQLLQKNDTPYYCAGTIQPVGLDIDRYLKTSHIPSKEIQDEYIAFMASQEEKQEDESGQQKVNVKIGSLRERLMKKFTKPTLQKSGFYITDKNWMLLLRNISQKVNTMMIGPTGTGKTELVMLAAQSMGLECSVFDMGAMHDAISGLLGVHRLEKGGQSKFDYAEFTRAVSRPGIVLLDELSRAPVTTLNILFPCLDSRRTLPVEIAGGEDLRQIKVHPECVFIATANIGAEYTGTMSMDRALVSRFMPLELEYLPKNEEKSVLKRRYGISEKDALNLAAVAEQIRSLYMKNEIGATVSTRETLMAAAMVADGWTTLEAMEAVFLPLFEGDIKEGERSVINKIILTR